MPFDQSGSAWESGNNDFYRNNLVAQFHKILYQNNVGVDFIFPENPRFEDYDLVIIPSLYIASDELLNKINNYIKNGGHVIMQFKSGFSDENSMVRPVIAPGPLRESAGFYYQEFSNIKELSLGNDPFGVGAEKNKANTWAEYIILETAKPLAWYDHQYFKEYPAITINNYGQGTLLYEGCMVSDEIQEKIIQQAIERAGIKTPSQEIHWPLITKSGKNENGNTIRFYYNYSSEVKTFVYPHKSGNELISNRRINSNESVSIEPWDVIIIEE